MFPFSLSQANQIYLQRTEWKGTGSVTFNDNHFQDSRMSSHCEHGVTLINLMNQLPAQARYCRNVASCGKRSYDRIHTVIAVGPSHSLAEGEERLTAVRETISTMVAVLSRDLKKMQQD